MRRYRKLLMEMGLPLYEMPRLGLICPNCGRPDRIFGLKPPGELETNSPDYKRLWNGHGSILVFCRHCLELLKCNRGEGRVVLFDENDEVI